MNSLKVGYIISVIDNDKNTSGVIIDIDSTSKNIIWSHPNNPPIKNSVAVLPEVNNYSISECLGICSDYIKNYV